MRQGPHTVLLLVAAALGLGLVAELVVLERASRRAAEEPRASAEAPAAPARLRIVGPASLLRRKAPRDRARAEAAGRLKPPETGDPSAPAATPAPGPRAPLAPMPRRNP